MDRVRDRLRGSSTRTPSSAFSRSWPLRSWSGKTARPHDWKQVLVDGGIEVYFCDPYAPWQRGSHENTNGLWHQYFPKGTDFATVSEGQLDAVADELND